MGNIDALRRKVIAGDWEFSRHAVDQCLVRSIAVDDVRECILSGEIIEAYPDDKYGPSCLVLGPTSSGKMLHVHCSDEARPILKIVTAYQPDPRRWQDFRYRRNIATGDLDGD